MAAAVGSLAVQGEHVVLEQCVATGQWSLLSTISHERVLLEPGDWELDFEHGLAYITSEQGTRWASEVFQKAVYRRPDGGWFWQEVDSLGQVLLVDAAEASKAYTACECSIGDNIATMKHFTVWNMKLVTAGSHCWFRVKHFVQAVGFPKAASKPWSTVYIKSWERWDAALAALGLPGSLRKSIQYSTVEVGDDDRLFDEACISLHGMLALLARSSMLQRSQGGLRDEPVRARAVELLLAFVRRGGLPRRLVVFMDAFEWHPPRLPRGADAVCFTIDHDLQVDVSDLHRLAEGPGPDSHAENFLKHLAVEGQVVRLVDMISLLFSRRDWFALCGQVLARLADAVDAALVKELHMRGRALRQPGLLRLAGCEGMSRQQIANELVRYQATATKLLGEAKHMCMTTDDSNFASRNRKLSAVVLPCNVAVWLAPQAPCNQCQHLWVHVGVHGGLVRGWGKVGVLLRMAPPFCSLENRC